MSLLQKLKEKDPERNVVFTAVDTLTQSAEMREFYNEYVAYLREKGDTKKIRQNAEHVAYRNIMCAVGYYDNKTADRWPKVIHSSN